LFLLQGLLLKGSTNLVSRPSPNLLSRSSNHYESAEIFSENFYRISKICGRSYMRVFKTFRLAFKGFSFIIVNFLLMISDLDWSSHRSPLLSQVASLPEPEMRTGFNDDTTPLNLDLRATNFSGIARDLWNEQLCKSSQKLEEAKGKTQRYLPEIYQPYTLAGMPNKNFDIS